jgi:hypothetical protein
MALGNPTAPAVLCAQAALEALRDHPAFEAAQDAVPERVHESPLATLATMLSDEVRSPKREALYRCQHHCHASSRHVIRWSPLVIKFGLHYWIVSCNCFVWDLHWLCSGLASAQW